jgi:signal transduction histidine kinase
VANRTETPPTIAWLDRLSTKITIAAAGFVFALAGAIIFLVNSGIRSTQFAAYSSSQEVLATQARMHLEARAVEVAHAVSFAWQSEGAQTSADQINQYLEGWLQSSQSENFILTEEGGLLAASGSPGERTAKEYMQAGAALPDDGSGVIDLEMSGQPMLLAYAPLAIPGYYIVLVSALDAVENQSETLAISTWRSAETAITTTMLLVMGVSLIALVALPLVMDRLVTRRVSRLTAGVQAITANQLDISIPPGPPDELGILAESFNQMTVKLEQRVVERTREISYLHEQAEQRNRELEVLYHADEQLYRHLRLDQVLQALVDVTVDLLKADKASVMVWNEKRQRLELRAWRNFSTETVQQLQDYKTGDGVAGKVFQSGELMAVGDARQASPPANQIAEREGIASILSVPISISKQAYGVFGMDYCQPRKFDEAEIRLFTALAQRAAIAIENARLYEQAEQAATLEERQRLARELHDAVTQSLYSLVLLSEAGRRYASLGNLEQVEHHLSRLGETSQQALKEMRLLVYELRPLALQKIGLDGAIRQRLEAVEKRAGIRTHLAIQGDLDLPGKLDEELYRIAQEALNNALKHAHASEVTVKIRGSNHTYELEVSDNGDGFDLSNLPGGGFGLDSMRERAERLGGRLEIISQPGTGTLVCLHLDLANKVNNSFAVEVTG